MSDNDERLSALLVLTIGQAPREDIQAELRDVLGDMPMEVRGALDGMTLDEISAIPPIEDADALHTHLPSGHNVVISKKAVAERFIPLLEQAPPGPVLVACTGAFSGLPDRAEVLFPSAVLSSVVDAVLPTGKLGVLVPIEQQRAPFEARWSTADRPATVEVVTPGTSGAPAAQALADAGVDLIVLDCFGYESDLLEEVRRVSGRPVLSAVRLCAGVAQELLA